MSLFPTDRIIVGGLCYVVQDRRALLLRRRRPPHQGRWTAPGGKLEHGESPQQGIVREMVEETGLLIPNPVLRGVVTVVDVAVPVHWLLFIFRAEEFQGNLIQTEEGELRWISVDCLAEYPMPYSDVVYLPRVLPGNGSLFHAKFVYDTPDRCIEEVFY